MSRPRSPAFPGINRTYLSKLGRARANPRLEIIVKRVTVLEVEPSELLRLAVLAAS
jgi:hypothetical protein